MNDVNDRFQKWLSFVKEKHNNKYDYSLVDYKNARTKVKIICPVHGIFEQEPYSHKLYGCPECGKEATHQKQRLSQDEFLKRMNDKYGNDLVFKEEYKNADTKILVHCSICGTDFRKSPSCLNVNGCPNCGNIKRQKTLKSIRYKKAVENLKLKNVVLLDEYKGRMKTRGHNWKRYNFKCSNCGYIFKDFFDYKHEILCPICNPGKLSSKGELEIRKYISDNYPELKIIPNDRTILEGKEIDILIPELNIGIEYDGIYWHKDREKYDKQKDIKALSKGVVLFHIKEKRTKKEKLKNFEIVDKIIQGAKIGKLR